MSSRHPQPAGPEAPEPLVTPGGRGEEALLRIVAGRDELVLSKPLVLELLDVLARKFDRDADELARVAVFLSDLATIVDPAVRVAVLRDEPHNRVLECALAGRVEAVVTGDRAMLALGRFEGIEVLTLATYLARPCS